MAIEIIYRDADTKEVLAERFVSDAMIKALSTDMKTSSPVIFLDWHTNALWNKARQMIDVVCEGALGTGSKYARPLSDTNKQGVATELAKEGYILAPPIKQMNSALKEKIVELADVITGAERTAEVEEF